MKRRERAELRCTLNADQVQRIRGALTMAVTVLNGLFFTTLNEQQKKALLVALETADHIRKVLTEVEALTAEIPRGEHEGEFGNE
jgi:hypothetical protein